MTSCLSKLGSRENRSAEFKRSLKILKTERTIFVKSYPYVVKMAVRRGTIYVDFSSNPIVSVSKGIFLLDMARVYRAKGIIKRWMDLNRKIDRCRRRIIDLLPEDEKRERELLGNLGNRHKSRR